MKLSGFIDWIYTCLYTTYTIVTLSQPSDYEMSCSFSILQTNLHTFRASQSCFFPESSLTSLKDECCCGACTNRKFWVAAHQLRELILYSVQKLEVGRILAP